MCPAGLCTISPIVLVCVREGGNKRKVWQLKAFLQGHPHRLALLVNSDSHSLVVCLQRNSHSVSGSQCHHVAQVCHHLILLDTFIVSGASKADMDAGCFN